MVSNCEDNNIETCKSCGELSYCRDKYMSKLERIKEAKSNIIYYHGTKKLYARHIQRGGLELNHKPNYKESKGYIYLTKDFDSALLFSKEVCQDDISQLTVIQISGLPESHPVYPEKDYIGCYFTLFEIEPQFIQVFDVFSILPKIVDKQSNLYKEISKYVNSVQGC